MLAILTFVRYVYNLVIVDLIDDEMLMIMMTLMKNLAMKAQEVKII